MTFPVGTRIRETATGDLGTVVEPERNVDPTSPPVPADAVWAAWDNYKREHIMYLPASEVEAVTDDPPSKPRETIRGGDAGRDDDSWVRDWNARRFE